MGLSLTIFRWSLAIIMDCIDVAPSRKRRLTKPPKIVPRDVDPHYLGSPRWLVVWLCGSVTASLVPSKFSGSVQTLFRGVLYDTEPAGGCSLQAPQLTFIPNLVSNTIWHIQPHVDNLSVGPDRAVDGKELTFLVTSEPFNKAAPSTNFSLLDGTTLSNVKNIGKTESLCLSWAAVDEPPVESKNLRIKIATISIYTNIFPPIDMDSCLPALQTAVPAQFSSLIRTFHDGESFISTDGYVQLILDREFDLGETRGMPLIRYEPTLPMALSFRTSLDLNFDAGCNSKMWLNLLDLESVVCTSKKLSTKSRKTMDSTGGYHAAIAPTSSSINLRWNVPSDLQVYDLQISNPTHSHAISHKVYARLSLRIQLNLTTQCEEPQSLLITDETIVPPLIT